MVDDPPQLHCGVEPPRAGAPQPGSAGLGVYQTGSLRSASRLSVEIIPFKAADPRILSIRSGDVRCRLLPSEHAAARMNERERQIERAASVRWIDDTIPRARTAPAKKEAPATLEGAHRAEGLLWAGKMSKKIRPRSDYARPIRSIKRASRRWSFSNYLQLPGCSLHQFPLVDWATALLPMTSGAAIVSTNTPSASAAIIRRFMSPPL